MSQFDKKGLKWPFYKFLRHFYILIFDQNKRHKALVSVIRVNGCMLPPSLCAKNNNLTLFWHQTNGYPVLRTDYFKNCA